MPDQFDPLDMVLACLKQMEATVLGMKQLRSFIWQGFRSRDA
jgi:hypothetical protein